MSTHAAAEVVVVARGQVSATERAYAETKIGNLARLAWGPVLFARVELTHHGDPARERPAHAKAEMEVDGRMVRAHVAAAGMLDAIDRLEARLRDRLERFAHHEESKHLRFRARGEHLWRHGEPAGSRPGYFPRPVEDRELVRRKTFAVGATSPDEAVLDLELLDHDFYLFTNRATGEDNVIARSDEGDYVLFEPTLADAPVEAEVPIRRSEKPAPTLDADAAVEVLELGGLRFLFFLDPDDGRGRVLYHRYDGHYGLITPAAEAA